MRRTSRAGYILTRDGTYGVLERAAHLRVLRPHEMARVDRAAIEDEGIDGLTLMENAGRGVANIARDMLTGAMGDRVAIWCGKGNNGGDGLVAARLLAGWGYSIEVFLLAEPEDLSKDARVNLDRLEDVRVEVVTAEDGVTKFRESRSFDLVVDAIFGTGFSGRVDGIYASAIEAINDTTSPVLSVDIPSGVCGDTGAAEGPAVRASRTATLAAPKVGLVQFPGAAFVGDMEVVDIGIPAHLLQSVPRSRMFLTDEDYADGLLPRRQPDAHKWKCGSVLVVGGSPGMTGATALCARAAMRSGAGMVMLAVPEGLAGILEIKTTETITRPLPQGEAGTISMEAMEAIIELTERYDVLALGPGISVEGETPRLVRELVGRAEVPTVLDADGLNAMAGHTEIFRQREQPLVVTPHPGEMARLIGGPSADVQKDRITTALDASVRWGVVVVLKGAGTVVAEPEGTVRINTTGNAGMASAGMGDVLTGCIAALIAQGLSPFDAAVAGVYFHGHAADLVANMDGMVGMVAGDVIRHLPLSMRKREM